MTWGLVWSLQLLPHMRVCCEGCGNTVVCGDVCSAVLSSIHKAASNEFLFRLFSRSYTRQLYLMVITLRLWGDVHAPVAPDGPLLQMPTIGIPACFDNLSLIPKFLILGKTVSFCCHLPLATVVYLSKPLARRGI